MRNRLFKLLIIMIVFWGPSSIWAQNKNVKNHLQNIVNILAERDADKWMDQYPDNKIMHNIYIEMAENYKQNKFKKEFEYLVIETEVMKFRRKTLKLFLEHFNIENGEGDIKFENWKGLKVIDITNHQKEEGANIFENNGMMLLENVSTGQLWLARYKEVYQYYNFIFNAEIGDVEPITLQRYEQLKMLRTQDIAEKYTEVSVTENKETTYHYAGTYGLSNLQLSFNVIEYSTGFYINSATWLTPQGSSLPLNVIDNSGKITLSTNNGAEIFLMVFQVDEIFGTYFNTNTNQLEKVRLSKVK